MKKIILFLLALVATTALHATVQETQTAVALTATQVAVDSQTPTFTVSPTPTQTFTVSPNPTFTPNRTTTAIAAGTQTQVAVYTQTAVATQTKAAATKTAVANLHATQTAVIEAAWTQTNTPIATYTPQPSPTFSMTFTLTPTPLPVVLIDKNAATGKKWSRRSDGLSIDSVGEVDGHGNSINGKSDVLSYIALNATTGTAYTADYVTVTGNSILDVINSTAGSIHVRLGISSAIPTDIQTNNILIPTGQPPYPMRQAYGYNWLYHSSTQTLTGTAVNGY